MWSYAARQRQDDNGCEAKHGIDAPWITPTAPADEACAECEDDD